MDPAVIVEILKQSLLGGVAAVEFWVIVQLARKVQALNDLRIADTKELSTVMNTSAIAIGKQYDAILGQKDSIAALARATEDDSRALRSLESAVRELRYMPRREGDER